MLKKLYVSTLVLLVTILSMTVSVFAWFANAANLTDAEELVGYSEGNLDLDIGDVDSLELFVGAMGVNLMYLEASGFNNSSMDLYGLSSIIELSINNTDDVDMNVHFSLASFYISEYGPLSGDVNSLEYLVTTSKTKADFNALKYQEIDSISENDFLTNLATFNETNTILIPQGETVDVYIFVWGNFDKLTETQKPVYHTVTYRIKVRSTAT